MHNLSLSKPSLIEIFFSNYSIFMAINDMFGSHGFGLFTVHQPVLSIKYLH